MTRRPLRPCNNPGCPELVRPPERYCGEHQHKPRERHRRYDELRGTAAERGYDHRWQKASAAFRRRHPLCWECEGRGKVRAADVVDHVIPHEGDKELFWARENWQPLCTSDHNRKTNHERDGFHRLMYPRDVRRLASPCTVVAGPPASGKSTYVNEHGNPGDVLIDLDEIQAALSSLPLYRAGGEWLQPALMHRNDLLRRLMVEPVDGRVWFIAGAPRPAERWFWRTRLGADVVVLTTSAEECRQRIMQDSRREAVRDEHLRAVDRWWRAYREG